MAIRLVEGDPLTYQFSDLCIGDIFRFVSAQGLFIKIKGNHIVYTAVNLSTGEEIKVYDTIDCIKIKPGTKLEIV